MPPASALVVCSTGATHRGHHRPVNQDALLLRPDQGLWAVCDGVGGHTAGDLASRMIIEGLDQLPLARDGAELLARVRHSLSVSNDELQLTGDGVVIASTVVALLVRDEQAICLWAGDSRAYRLRAGRLEQLTRDHSLVQQWVDQGQLAPEQADSHPKAHVLTRAIGAGSHLALDQRQMTIEPGDLFLLCSDGLSRTVPAPLIARLLAGQATAGETGGDTGGKTTGADPLAAIAGQLIDQALAAGGPDNITVVLVAFDLNGSGERSD